MTTLRNQSTKLYNIGSEPPQVIWTVVRGDTAAFRIYVTDDASQPLNIPDWNISMEFKRPNVLPSISKDDMVIITDNAATIFTLHPSQQDGDGSGEFTASLTAAQSNLLESGDIFDVELSLPEDAIVWTVAQGKMKILEDVTDL